MKKKLFLLFAALLAVGQNVFAYDFSYTYQGKTLFYTIESNGVRVDNPLNGNYYSYVTGVVVIPDSVENNGTKYAVTSIGSNAFHGCSGLTSIVVEVGNTHYDSRDNCNAIIQTDLNLLIQGCNSTVIPNTVTAIGDWAFWGCSGLTSVTIPNSVTSIGGSAFYGCTGLTSVTIGGSVTSIGSWAFSNCSGLTSVTIPNSVTIDSRPKRNL